MGECSHISAKGCCQMYKENERSPTQATARAESGFLTAKVALSTLATASATADSQRSPAIEVRNATRAWIASVSLHSRLQLDGSSLYGLHPSAPAGQTAICGRVCAHTNLDRMYKYNCIVLTILINQRQARLERIGAAVIDTWQQHFSASGVTPPDMDDLADRIAGSELAAQRRDFSAASYLKPAPWPRRRPF
jgi:hypothetical protein